MRYEKLVKKLERSIIPSSKEAAKAIKTLDNQMNTLQKSNDIIHQHNIKITSENTELKDKLEAVELYVKTMKEQVRDIAESNHASIEDKYMHALVEAGISTDHLSDYAKAFAYRQSRGQAIPASTYKRCKEFLYYKDSLKAKSPYYVDLLKIEDADNLKIVLTDLCNTVKIK